MTRFLPVFVAFVFVALPAFADATGGLFDAAREGTEAEVKAALEAGADVNARDEGGRTALHWAAWKNEPAVVKALLDAGAKTNPRDIDHGFTPLLDAAYNPNPSVIEALIEAGANANARGRGGWTGLHAAAQNGHAAAIAALLEAGADPSARAGGGVTPLHVATEDAHLSVIEALLAADADPNAREDGGKTPLHLVVFGAGTYDRLLRDVAVGNLTRNDGPALAARKLGVSPRIVRLMLERGKAVLERSPSVIEALLDAGADPTLRDEDGKIPFDYAKDNEALKGTEAYWRLNDGRFE